MTEFYCTRKSCLFSPISINCKSGCTNHSVYGNGCDTKCPINCQDSLCHIRNGTCFACRPGWKGDTCQTSTNVKSSKTFDLIYLLWSPVVHFLFFFSQFGAPSVHLLSIFRQFVVSFIGWINFLLL